MSSADGIFVFGWSSAESTVYVYDTGSVKVSPEQDHHQVLVMDVCGPSLLYLGWSTARVNYWRAPVPCVTGDRQGWQNIVMLPCPILKSIESKSTHVQMLFTVLLSFTLNPCLKKKNCKHLFDNEVIIVQYSDWDPLWHGIISEDYLRLAISMRILWILPWQQMTLTIWRASTMKQLC